MTGRYYSCPPNGHWTVSVLYIRALGQYSQIGLRKERLYTMSLPAHSHHIVHILLSLVIRVVRYDIVYIIIHLHKNLRLRNGYCNLKFNHHVVICKVQIISFNSCISHHSFPYSSYIMIYLTNEKVHII